jgi:hypothetical protein
MVSFVYRFMISRVASASGYMAEGILFMIVLIGRTMTGSGRSLETGKMGCRQWLLIQTPNACCDGALGITVYILIDELA